MKIDASIFKAYDIRGVVDHTLTEDAVRAVGRVPSSRKSLVERYD